jgi:phage gp36-like protein
MSYSTVAQVRNLSGFQSVINFPDSFIQGKIDEADSMIDSRIGDAYALPLASTPALISSISAELTVAIIFIDQYGDEAKNGDKGWKKRMDYVDSMIESIQLLEMKLIDPTTKLELQRAGTRLPSGYPNAASSAPGPCSTAPKIRMNKRW